MIVALGAMHGHGAECIQRVGDHVVAVEVTGDFAIDFFLSDFGVTDQVPRAGGYDPASVGWTGPAAPAAGEWTPDELGSHDRVDFWRWRWR